MKILKWFFRLLIGAIFVILAIVAIRYLILGGWTEFTQKYAELDKNLWSFVKWFFSSMWAK